MNVRRSPVLVAVALAAACRSAPTRPAPAPAAAPTTTAARPATPVDTQSGARPARDTRPAPAARRAAADTGRRATPDTGDAALKALALAALATERELAPGSAATRALGVLPWRAGAEDTLIGPLSYGLADLLMTDLSRSARLRVVDRLRLEALRTELQLAASGHVDSAGAPRAGSLLRAHQLLLGGITRLRNGRLRVDAAVADVATGELRPALTATAPLTDILAAEKALAHRIFRQLGVTLTPAERAAVDQRPTRDLAALLAYGRAVRFGVEGRYAEAGDQYAAALRMDPRFTVARTRGAEARARGARATVAQADAKAKAEAKAKGEAEREKASADEKADNAEEGGEKQSSAAGRNQRARAGRAIGLAAERINRSFLSPGVTWRRANAADPSFPALQAVIIINIEVP